MSPAGNPAGAPAPSPGAFREAVLDFPGVATRTDFPEDHRRRLREAGAAVRAALPPEFLDLLVLRALARPRPESPGLPAFHLGFLTRGPVLDLRPAGEAATGALRAAGLGCRLGVAVDDQLVAEVEEGEPTPSALVLHGASILHDRPAADRSGLLRPPSPAVLQRDLSGALHALRCLAAALVGENVVPDPAQGRVAFRAEMVPLMVWALLNVHGRLLEALEGRRADGLLPLEESVARALPIDATERNILAGFEDADLQTVPRLRSGALPGRAERERLLAAGLLLGRMLERTAPAAGWRNAAEAGGRLAELLREAAGTARELRRATLFSGGPPAPDEGLPGGGEGPGGGPPRNAPCPCGSGRKFKKCCARV